MLENLESALREITEERNKLMSQDVEALVREKMEGMEAKIRAEITADRSNKVKQLGEEIRGLQNIITRKRAEAFQK